MCALIPQPKELREEQGGTLRKRKLETCRADPTRKSKEKVENDPINTVSKISTTPFKVIHEERASRLRGHIRRRIRKSLAHPERHGSSAILQGGTKGN